MIELIGLSLWGEIARAQGSEGFAHWTIALEGKYGAPSGHVQVRENRIQGTRLNFGSDLGVNDIWTAGFDLGYRFDTDNSLRFALQNETLICSKRLPQEVNFNGATLAGDTTLKTVTRFPNFLRTTLFYQHPLPRLRERRRLVRSDWFHVHVSQLQAARHIGAGLNRR
jgi:hypothetical protein